MNKRNVCSELASRFGLLRLLEVLPKRDCLLVLNYHRIGNSLATDFDEGVFSASEEEFEVQVSHVRRLYTVVTLNEALELISVPKRFRGVAVLITFDDGYIDNYTAAFPILHSLGVQGTFFLISSQMDHPEVMWWDKIAYFVRNSQQNKLLLTYPEVFEIPLPPGRRSDAIRRVLRLYKSSKTTDSQRFLTELEIACTPTKPLSTAARQFLNYGEAREMISGGMAVGSHTHTHQILAKLSRDDQLEEISRSHSILSRELGSPVRALAYPVGGKNAFTELTKSVLEEAGYSAAFSYYGGFNVPGSVERFDIRRVAIDAGHPFSRFRTQVALSPRANGYWF